MTEPRRGGRLVTALDVAETYLNTAELEGSQHNPAIVAMLQAVMRWATADEIPWCSAFAHEVCLRLGLPRSKSPKARTWLQIGSPVAMSDAQPGQDVVVLKRGGGPGPETIDAPGHVGFYAGRVPGFVMVLGGNQGDAVTLARFPVSDVLGIRRLA